MEARRVLLIWTYQRPQQLPRDSAFWLNILRIELAFFCISSRRRFLSRIPKTATVLDLFRIEGTRWSARHIRAIVHASGIFQEIASFQLHNRQQTPWKENVIRCSNLSDEPACAMTLNTRNEKNGYEPQFCTDSLIMRCH